MRHWLWDLVPPWTTLKDWQTAISAGIGFIGVILTLLFNAWLARRADIRRRHHDRLSLRAAFRTELGFLKDQATGIVRQLLEERDPQTGIRVQIRFSTVVYDRNNDKLGILSDEEIQAILNAYLFLRTVGDRLLMLGERVGISQHVNEDWVALVGKTTLGIVKKNMEHVTENVDAALRAIAAARR